MSDFRADMQRHKVKRDLVTVGPIFKKKNLKDAQDSKEKSQRAAGRHPYAFSNNQKNRGGGGGHNGPPALLVLNVSDGVVVIGLLLIGRG